ncbi:MAG TPA: aldo/keto reductase [Arsenicitalea sp.]|nr:aldo/keto reductase [Arsenicitalea sp.]
MKRKTLGRTGIEVTQICLGTMTWGRQNTEAEGHAQIDYALDAGINFMDTAEVYAVPSSAETYGTTETIIGTWFKKTGKRDKFVLATKISGGRNGPWIRNGVRPDGKMVREAVEGSLKRLQTDYIDLYQIHQAHRGHHHWGQSWSYRPETQDRADTLANLHDVLDALGALVKEGKIRAVGLSNDTSWGTGQFIRLAAEHGLPRVATVQNEYNLLQRHFDLDMAELSHHEDVGLLAYSPLAAGVLTGKYLGGAVPPGTRGAIQQGGSWRQNVFSEPATRSYMEVARNNGLDIAQMAIAFCLTRPFMTSTIIGATTMEQLKTDIAAAELTLSEKVMDDIHGVHRQYPRTI